VQALTDHYQDDTLIPISVQSPSSPNVMTNGSNNTSKPGASIFTALSSHPQPVQTNATTFSNHIATDDSPDLHFFATTGDGTVKIMNYPSFNIEHTLNAHTSSCMAVSLAPTGRYLAIGGSDALISLWDTTDWICHRTLSSENGGGIRGVSWSFDGRFICGAWDELGCGGNGLEIFHAESGEIVYSVPVNGINACVPAVAWHPSRYWLAFSTTNDGPGSGGAGGLKIVGAAGGSL
jgi:THO complex subunit 3